MSVEIFGRLAGACLISQSVAGSVCGYKAIITVSTVSAALWRRLS
jgi:hypothetical protein